MPTSTHTVLASIDAAAVFPAVSHEGPAPHETITWLDPAAPNVNAFDLGLIRGDGIFEATTVWRGIPLALRLHLLRLASSAKRDDLPEPDLVAWESALLEIVQHAVKVMGAEHDYQLKILVTRGADATTNPGALQHPGTPHIFVFVDEYLVDPNGADPQNVITLPKEISTTAVTKAPWMLYGVKTLSYAINMAAYREVARRGATNAVFYSTDDVVLEGPTSSVVWRTGDTFYTPEPSIGILHGTTQIEMYAFLAEQGFEHEYGLYSPDALRAADQVWILGGSKIHTVATIDGRDLSVDHLFTRTANMFMREERETVEAYALEEWARMHDVEVPWIPVA